MSWVYVVQNDNDGEIYIGFTTDLKQRIFQHNRRGRKFTTRKSGEWKLVYAELYRSENDARNRESKLKQHGGGKRQLLKRIKNSLFEPKNGAGCN